MDAKNPSTHPTHPTRCPVHVGAYGLVVRDLDRCIAFYRQAVGLGLIRRSADEAVLGVGNTALLHLEHRPDAKPDEKSAAGLFHTAFLMPTRQDLADWYQHAQRIGLVIPRTGDHAVNEAIYFDDPEGNGCECYADRPAETWVWFEDNTVDITTGAPVDLADLAKLANPDRKEWSAPAGLRIGHINLRVGDTAQAEAFYCGPVGLDHTGRRDIDFSGKPNTITFMSSGRYHHHFAANNFFSRGAGMRDPQRSGLSWFSFVLDDADLLAARRRRVAAAAPVSETDGGFETTDPWGTRVRFTARV
jgi:catechol 2,3-dioxygenase